MIATYGVMGMMEWVALIPTRSNLLRVRFSGGSLSGYGVTPATFTTRNPVVARMIESSTYFRRGRIRLLSKEEDPAAVPNPETPPRAAPEPETPQQADAEPYDGFAGTPQPRFRRTKPPRNGDTD